jgi:hypothetical protein
VSHKRYGEDRNKKRFRGKIKIKGSEAQVCMREKLTPPKDESEAKEIKNLI